MAVKVLIKRKVPKRKAIKVIPLFRQIRSHAIQQTGYISGETMKRLDKPNQFLIISTWQSSEDWDKWVKTPERIKLQADIDRILGGETEYEIYHYGFTE
jgi:heme-degrading monooxygenase HmoA